MSIQQHHEHHGQHLGRGIQTVPLGALWSAWTSELGTLFSISNTPTATASSASTTLALEMTTAAQVTVPATAQVTVPVSTVTVESTVLRTSYLTLQLTTGLVETAQTFVTSISTSTSSSSILALEAPSSSIEVSDPVSTGLPVASSTSRKTTLPAVVTKGSETQSASSVFVPFSSAAVPTVTSGPAPQPSNSPPTHAVAGGLSGAIAGLVLIGVLLCFYVRRRKGRREEEEDGDSFNEKGLRPAIARKWTQLTSKGTPKPTPLIPQGTSPVTVDEEHHIIRMSTTHWARPFAQGRGEGYRESIGTSQLRVMNPDPARPTTPRLSSDTGAASSFLQRQRSALAAVLLSANRSRTSSRSNIHQATNVPVPEITIDPILSREWLAPLNPDPSFKSYPSVTTLPVVQQQPPEDPFVTPPLEAADPRAQQRPKRPTLAPLQSAAGAASRTLSHIGSFLNPFRTQSGAAESVKTFSRHSVSTLSSRLSRRYTAFSDPFDLDKPSERGSAVPGYTASDMERGQSLRPTIYELNRTIYEGT